MVTHGDPDHFDYAIPMAKETNASVICGEALRDDFSSEKIKDVHPVKVGGVVNFNDVKVEGLIAKHSPLPVKLFSD